MFEKVCFSSNVTEHSLFDGHDPRLLREMLPEATEAEIILAEANATNPILCITIK
jgi:hypothetical protein